MTRPDHDHDRTAIRVAKVSGIFALVAAVLGAVITGVFGLRDAEDKPAGAAPRSTVTAGPTSPTTQDPSPATTPGPPAFDVVYQDRTISTPVSGFSSFVDLDAPKVGAEMGDAEFWWSGSGQLRSALRWATVAGADASPAACADAVDADPLPNFVPARTGLTVCLLLDPASRTAVSAKERIFRVTVTDVTADRTVYRVSSWERTP